MGPKPVALITGCSTGIGFETALLLAREGWKVYATMRNLRKSGPLKKAAEGLPLTLLALDVDREASVKKALGTVLKREGRVDALVNNAGWGTLGALEDFSDAEVRAQFETNLFGLLRVTRAVLPSMRLRGSGRIVNVGSVAGRITFAGSSLYSATKFAVEALTEGLRLELRAFGVEACVVEPGMIRTRFRENKRKSGRLLSRKSAYGPFLKALDELNRGKVAAAPGPGVVAGVILKALRSRHLAARYAAGNDAKFYLLIRKLLPDLLFYPLVESRLPKH